MDICLLQIAIAAETDIVLVRSRTRRLAELIGFDAQDQTRITTAVSEIARNAYEYARRRPHRIPPDRRDNAPSFVIVVRDRGPGIADLAAVLSGSHKSATGMGIGLLGARRLMDTFGITSKPGEGTTVRLGKMLPRTRAVDHAGVAQAHHGCVCRREEPAMRSQEITQTEPADFAADGRAAIAPGGPAAAQSGAAGHQSRRRRAVRRAGRARRSPASRGRAEIEIPLAHEPRIPHAAQLDPGAVAAAAGAQ